MRSTGSNRFRDRITAGHKVAFACVGLLVMVAIRWELLVETELTTLAEISAWVLLIIGLWHSRNLDSHFEKMVQRLKEREALSLTGPELEAAIEKINRRADTFESIGSFTLLLIWFSISSFWTFHVNEEALCWTPVTKIVLESVGAFFVGQFTGRLVAYGLLGRWLENQNAEIHIQAGHPDGAGGLKVVGDYYLYQAGLVMLAVIFFGFWWAVAPELRAPFAFGFLGFLLIEFAVFLVPMAYLHREMIRHKDETNRKIDRMGCEVVQLKEEALTKEDPAETKSITTRYEALERRIQFLEALPEWPIDTGIRRRFAFGNLAVILIPTCAKVLFDSSDIQKILERLFS